jgi:hypothetical protein
MILTQVVFLTSDVDDIEVYLPHPPSKGEIVVFPFVKSGIMDFKIKDIEWVFDEYSKFTKIRVYLEED